MLTVKTEEKKEDTYGIGNLTTDQRREVRGMIQKNKDIFIKGKYEVGKTNMVKHTIDTGEEKPIKQKARRLSVKEKEIEKEHIEEIPIKNLYTFLISFVYGFFLRKNAIQ